MGGEDPGMDGRAPRASEEARPRRSSKVVGQGVGVAVDWQTLLPPKGFQELPRRWVVQRTIAWIDQIRRMSKDYERLCASGEAFVYAAMIRLMTRRLLRA